MLGLVPLRICQPPASLVMLGPATADSLHSAMTFENQTIAVTSFGIPMETACEDISAFNVTLVFSAGWSDTHGDIPSENRTSASSDQDSTVTESVGWDPHPVSTPRLMTSAGLARRCQFPGTIATQQGLLAAEIRPRDITP